MPGPMLAAIDEGAIRQQMRGIANFPRCRNPARLGHQLDTGGDIDGIAEDRLGLVDDDLAEMQPDAEHQALFLVERFVEARHPFLDVDRCRDRCHSRAEFGQHGVAHDVHDPAARGVDGRQPYLGAYRLQATDRAILATFHQPHVAGEVSLNDG
jgi:hypothetical protein